MSKLKLKSLFHFNEKLKELSFDNTYIGIDFGTSTTVVSIAVLNPFNEEIETRTLLLPQLDKWGDEVYDHLFPSVIASDLKTNDLIYGQGARILKFDNRYKTGINIWHSFKMELGKDRGPIWINSVEEAITSPQDATRIFFKLLKKSIYSVIDKEGYPKNVKYGVSIPASFEANQRKDLMDALLANGIAEEDITLIDEPNAAFISYVNDRSKEPIELTGSANPMVLVFDFGAGTCDLSLLEISADHNGIHSNNKSISKFSELGGNDIDTYISYNFLLPQLLKANNIEENNDLSTREISDIVEALKPVAEQIKIKLCKENFNYLLSDPDTLFNRLSENDGVLMHAKQEKVSLEGRELTIPEMRLSYEEFIKTMKVFFKTPVGVSEDIYLPQKQQRRYNSINEAIRTTLEKANVDRSKVKYVILVGGSCGNPFVQHRIRKYFKGAKIIVPDNLQMMVSRGAAIHSLLKHGMGIHAIRPIVGEQIMVVTRTKTIKVIKEGDELPINRRLEHELTTGVDELSYVRIPICSGKTNKMIYEMELRRSGSSPFPQFTPVVLTIDINLNKIMSVEAEALGEKWQVKLDKPFDNTEMSEGDKRVMKAQRIAYLSAEHNDHKPTPHALENLSRAYDDNSQTFLAAETLAERVRLYPDDALLNRVGVLFHNSGEYQTALKYYRKALETNPDDAVILSNISNDLYLTKQYDEARKYITKSLEIEKDDPIALTIMAKVEDALNNMEVAGQLFRRAFDVFNRRWKEDKLNRCEKGWFDSLAFRLGEKETSNLLEKELSAAKETDSEPSKANTLYWKDARQLSLFDDIDL